MGETTTAIDIGEDQPGTTTQVIALNAEDRRSLSINGLFVLATLAALFLASSLLIPIVLALLLSVLLGPVVRFLARIGLPEPVGAALVVASLLCVIVATMVGLSDSAQQWVDRIPRNFFRIEEKLKPLKKPLQDLSEVTKRLETAADVEPRRPLQVTVERPGIAEQVLSGTPQVLASIGIVILLLFFLLASGDGFLRKLVSVTPALRDKKRAVEITRSIQTDIAAYLATLTVVNMLLGLCVAGVSWAVGLPNPVLWGVFAALLSFAPYAGSTVIAAVLAFVGLLTFESWSTALLPAATYLMLMFLVGNVLVPFVLGRRLTLSPLAIFVAIIFWGWMWGVIGALVAVPLLASFKIVCDRVDALQPVAEFLSP